MSYTIAVAGKGGVGKTTVCGLLTDALVKRKKTPLLVVDADANSNLNEVLGVEAETTLGEIREEIAHAAISDDSPIPGGMSKQQYAEYRLNQTLIEEDDYDMLIMGRTQGEGCYCFVNGVLKAQLEKHASNYRYVLVDNEAGMEHISRGVLPHVDALIMVSDCSRRGIQAAARIAALADELGLRPKVSGLVVNRAPGGVMDAGTAEAAKQSGLNVLAVLPQSEEIYRFDCDGRPIIEISEDSPVRAAVNGLLEKII